MSFSQTFPDQPQVFAAVQTFNGADPLTVRVRDINRNDFEASLFEEEALMSGSHVPETVGYVAIWLPTNANITSPRLNPAAGSCPIDVRVSSAQTDQRGVPGLYFMEEEKSQDNEINHVVETTSVMTINNLFFGQISTFNGGDTIVLRRFNEQPN